MSDLTPIPTRRADGAWWLTEPALPAVLDDRPWAQHATRQQPIVLVVHASTGEPHPLPAARHRAQPSALTAGINGVGGGLIELAHRARTALTRRPRR